MDKNLAIQYTAVAVVLLLAIAWAVYKLVTKKSKGACSGCSLSETCAKKKSTHDCKN